MDRGVIKKCLNRFKSRTETVLSDWEVELPLLGFGDQLGFLVGGQGSPDGPGQLASQENGSLA